MLFLSFESFAVLCCVLFFVQNSRSYQADLMKVTDDIETPVPVGQYQHGSSRWLKEEEMDKVFAVCYLNPADKIIKELLETGYDGLGFLTGGQTEDTGIIGEQEDRKFTNYAVPINRGEEKEEGEKKEDVGIEDGFEPVEYTFEKGEPSEEKKEPEIKSRKQERQELEKKQVMPDPYCILREGGIVIGMTKCGNKEKIYYISDDTHTLTIGATRSGKTRTLVLQSICLMALAGESLVISDPKAELYEYVAQLLEKLGYDVICLDFKNPEKSSHYNLLQPIIDAVNAGEMDKAEMYAWDITNILVGDNTSNEKIWENGEKSTIAAAILCVVVDNAKRPEYQNLTNVYWFVAEMCKAVGNKTPMQEYVKKLKPGHPARALLSISDVAPSRTKGSFYTSALTTLRLFTSRSVYSITHKSDYDIADIGRKKQALFFILPDEKTTYYPIASLMVSQIYELLVRQSDERGGRLINRVNFVLEEFGNFTKLNDLPNKLTVAGGRGMRFHFFLQGFDQITEKYSKETASIVKGNCQSWIYLQADDKETLSEICDKLGKYTCSGYQLSSQHGRYVNPSSSSTLMLVGRELLTTDEIRRVSRPYQIVVSRSHPAMMVSPDLSKWYFNRMMGLGDKEHNRKVREERERKRPVRSNPMVEIPLWNIWIYYTKDLQMKEERQKQQGMPLQAGSLFSEKFMRRGGKQENNEEE
ncbi:type IV secretion system protein VirD4 [Kineothrix alysoides]|uniref:Type IV secretion system protein VirD4 n=1 Tax=Kineothrix alysoides TaxID=1469948 RepID=A0A4R1QVP9_9FIRM|nr:type IV secretory system conjugative DNA transfer family protein [Kineothrix alysoides]TCL57667.1 type IV secretion system protein VirD4 [Kineothrix alysoides]